MASGHLRALTADICIGHSSSTICHSVDYRMQLNGKHGLIVGVANKRSISWAIAQAAAAAGARVAMTYQGERLEENVRELADGLDRSAGPAARRHRRRRRSRGCSRRSSDRLAV